MLPLVLTGLVGVALGVVIMRLLQTRAAGAPQVPLADAAQASPTDAIVGEGEASPLPASPNFLGRFSKNQLMFGGAGLLGALALIAFAVRPAETPLGAPGLASGAPAAAPGDKALDDVDSMISRLAERLKTDTTDGEGFRMLGWSYVNTGHPAEAVTAYATAAKLLPDRADVHAGYGEAMVAVAKDVVTPEAKAEFDTAVKLNPKEPRAVFFQALFKAQNGKEREALDEWIALANDSGADLPWQDDLRKRITALAAKLGVDVSGKLKPAGKAKPVAALPAGSPGPDAAAMQAASKLPPAQQEGMINSMVDGLAAKLQANPDNVDGWVKLIRSRVVLDDRVRAKDNLAMARKVFADKPEKLGTINALATELGL
jgi:cytochrome c-type biogenesis protein CcmH